MTRTQAPMCFVRKTLQFLEFWVLGSPGLCWNRNKNPSTRAHLCCIFVHFGITKALLGRVLSPCRLRERDFRISNALRAGVLPSGRDFRGTEVGILARTRFSESLNTRSFFFVGEGCRKYMDNNGFERTSTRTPRMDISGRQ